MSEVPDNASIYDIGEATCELYKKYIGSQIDLENKETAISVFNEKIPIKYRYI